MLNPSGMPPREHHVEVVAADAAQQLRVAVLDLLRLARGDRADLLTSST